MLRRFVSLCIWSSLSLLILVPRLEDFHEIVGSLVTTSIWIVLLMASWHPRCEGASEAEASFPWLCCAVSATRLCSPVWKLESLTRRRLLFCVNTFATATGLACATYVSYVPSYDPCIYIYYIYIRLIVCIYSIWYIIILYMYVHILYWTQLNSFVLNNFISLEILYTSQTGARIMCVIVSDSVRIMLCGVCL
jgi:hypothetical protein